VHRWQAEVRHARIFGVLGLVGVLEGGTMPGRIDSRRLLDWARLAQSQQKLAEVLVEAAAVRQVAAGKIRICVSVEQSRRADRLPARQAPERCGLIERPDLGQAGIRRASISRGHAK